MFGKDLSYMFGKDLSYISSLICLGLDLHIVVGLGLCSDFVIYLYISW